MALNDTKIPSAASDVVAILDSGFNQIFASARPIKAFVNEPSKPMEHPLETGSIVTDNIIFLPREIELSMILPAPDYRSVYAQIVQTFRTATLLTVQTRTSTYKNMIIIAPPHEENADMFDAIPMIVKLKEVQIVSAATAASGTGSAPLPASSVKNPVDQSTINGGEKDKKTTYYFFNPDSGQSIPSAANPPSLINPGPRTEGGGALPEVTVTDRAGLPPSPGLQPLAITQQQTQDLVGAAQ